MRKQSRVIDLTPTISYPSKAGHSRAEGNEVTQSSVFENRKQGLSAQSSKAECLRYM
jgi:hypothetical protein